MNLQNTAHIIIEYRYWILIPLSVIEGPIVAFVAGTLASLGYFNPFALGGFFFARDMGMDALYYYLGYFGWKTAFAKRMLQKIHIGESHLDEVRLLWEKHPARTMFIGKLSYGIAAAFIVVAGVVKMRIRTFFTYGALVAVTQYGVLLALGYFFGNAFGGNISRIIENIQYVIAGVTVTVSAYYIFGWHVRRKFSRRIEQ